MMSKQAATTTAKYLIGIDVGGTFTDLIAYDRVSRKVLAFKVPSNRAEPDKAVLAALNKSEIPDEQVELLVHGTTVATNALLERRGAKIAFVTTKGFRDVLELGRTTRLVPNTLYDPYFIRPDPLADRRDRCVVNERTLSDGTLETVLDEGALEALAEVLKRQGIEAVAIGFINAYRNPANENAARSVLERHFEYVTVSTEVLNEVREFERFSAASINAYVMPVMARYTERLTASIKQRNAWTSFYTIASHGGLLSTPAVVAQPVRTILSGPAAGIAATVHFARFLVRPRILAYDMGGTSTDVALVHDYEFPVKRETVLDGLIIKVPQLDIHTVGAGGGSIATLDAGGGLQLGPESAGAKPGPASYGLGGTRPTVTDANVILGRLGSGQELGKSLRIDRSKAEKAMEPVAQTARLNIPNMAESILKLAVAKMAVAIREISIMRGFDPREFSLLCYGGAGPLHAALVAEEVGIKEVIVPPNPGAFSAFGALCSALRKDRTATVLQLLTNETLELVKEAETKMRQVLLEDFVSEGSDVSGLAFERQLDMRYHGQSHELTVTVPENTCVEDVAEIYEAIFEREYGRRDKNRKIEIVNLRLAGTIPMQTPQWIDTPDGVGNAAGNRTVFIDNRKLEVPIWNRDDLRANTKTDGPLIVEEMSSTTYVPLGWTLRRGHVGEMYLNQAS
jgi:N-methylhydantoinase A